MKAFFKLFLTLFIINSFLSSCKKNEHKEYYENRKIKKIFHKNNKNQKEGIYKEYFRNGNLKESHIYDDDIKVDSSIYYFEDLNRQVKEVRYWSDTINYCIFYNENGVKIKEGRSLTNDFNFRIGNWIFSDEEAKIDSIVEYKTIKQKPYTNQIWIMNKDGDTLSGRGNFFEIYQKDSLYLGDLVRIRFFLREYFYGEDSDIEVILPQDDSLLDDDFSNLFEIDRDTLFSLRNDGIPHPEIPSGVPINHLIEFGINYDEPGEKKIRGVLTEYIYDYLDNAKYPDSLYRMERRLFFEKTFFIKDTIIK